MAERKQSKVKKTCWKLEQVRFKFTMKTEGVNDGKAEQESA